TRRSSDLHVPQHVPFPAEVLHELAGQLDRVPLDAIDAGDAEVVDAGKQMMQAVAELVEQREHLVMREGGRSSADGTRKVARQVRDRKSTRGAFAPARDRVIH